jgi:putative hydrolase of the HAD superfamily
LIEQSHWYLPRQPVAAEVYDPAMAFRGVLFDLDGTLVDTAAAEREAWPELAAVLGARVPGLDPDRLYLRYNSVFERHWVDYLDGRVDFGEYRRRRLTDALEPWCEVDDELFEAYRAEKRRSVERLRPFDDTVRVLRELRATGLRLALLTNGPSELQRHKLAVTGLEPELDAIAISEEIGVAKPDAEAFSRAAAMIALAPGEVAMVGDSPDADIAGGLGAGVAFTILVAQLATTPNGGERAVVRSLTEAAELLLSERG